LNLQGKSNTFLGGGAGVYFHRLWTRRVEEICREEFVLKASHGIKRNLMVVESEGT
jgi:hypothetical protein